MTYECKYDHLYHLPLKQEEEHHHEDGKQCHSHTRTKDKKLLAISFLITFIVMFVEIAGGIYANSLALISDAIHMFTHSFALALSLFAIYISAKDPNDFNTFGYFRAEILAAFINGITIALSVVWIIYEAVIRFLHPEEILSQATLIIAVVGLVVNLLTGYILLKADQENLNISSAFLHMVTDAVSSVAIIIGAVIIYYTNLFIIDTLIAFLVALLISKWAYKLLKDSTHILLEGSPVDIALVKKEVIEHFVNVIDVHDIHCWEITNGYYYLTAHIVLDKSDEIRYDEAICQISKFLEERFLIGHTTLQIESGKF